MALVPFEPSSSDLEKAIIDVTEGQAIPLLTDLPRTPNTHFTPGSTWGKSQLCALNVIVLLDIENHRIIPGEYIPDDDDKDFSMLKCDIGRVDIDGLRDFDKDDLSSSKFMELFSYLSVCVRTGISEETILKREYGRERGLSDLSLGE